MNLLYLMNQWQLQYDELDQFNRIPGVIAWSPTAIYARRDQIDNGGKDKLDRLPQPEPEWDELRHNLESKWQSLPRLLSPEVNLPDRALSLTPEFLEEFDALYVCHEGAGITRNREAILEWGGKVFLRDLGQTYQGMEPLYAEAREMGCTLIRYSPKSRLVEGYCGEDHMIRFGKNPDDYREWQGGTGKTMAMCQSMEAVGAAKNLPAFTSIAGRTPVHLYGPGNDGLAFSAGYLDVDEIPVKLSQYNCFLSGGSYPAPYTLAFMEAAFGGTPIVALGMEALDRGFDHYEVPDIMESWGLGHWVAKSPRHAVELITETLASTAHDLKARSDAQVAGAHAMFEYDTVIPQWSNLFLK